MPVFIEKSPSRQTARCAIQKKGATAPKVGSAGSLNLSATAKDQVYRPDGRWSLLFTLERPAKRGDSPSARSEESHPGCIWTRSDKAIADRPRRPHGR